MSNNKIKPCIKCQKAGKRVTGHMDGICPLDKINTPSIKLSKPKPFDVEAEKEREKVLRSKLNNALEADDQYSSITGSGSSSTVNGWDRDETIVNGNNWLGDNQVGPSIETRYVKDNGDGTAEIIELTYGIEIIEHIANEKYDDWYHMEPEDIDGDCMGVVAVTITSDATSDGEGGWDYQDSSIDYDNMGALVLDYKRYVGEMSRYAANDLMEGPIYDVRNHW